MTCDGCGKDRRDVQSCGRDANGDPDAPDLCFLCRVEGKRGRFYDRTLGKYVRESDLLFDEISEAEARAIGEEQVREGLEAEALFEASLTNTAQ